ncbi:eugenol synthase 1-like [Punica granatum]|uniref:Eugenol synthase 1-like n=1 Tax=Punica granatum TaxID=22663 RepID=A0A6P8BQN5_PUNGR|nr:eugenol synthase 1-like [Punica granatum]
MEGGDKWKILFFGGTGYIGKYMVRASVALGHPTTVYARPLSSDSIPPTNLHLRDELEAIGVTIVEGELEEHEKMVSAMREADVVISALPYPLVPAQLKIIQAIKHAGNIKRFLPSDFGVEEDRITALPPFQAFLDKKKCIRRATEAAGIPYTYVSANCFGAYFINYLLHPSEQRNDVLIFGTGDGKVVLNYEEDIARYTIKVACDPRACNRVVIYRLPKNILSQIELTSLWEKKTGRTLERVHIPEEEIVKLSQTLPDPQNIPLSIIHSVFVKGDLMSYELKEDDIEVSRLYPDMDYTSIDQLLDIFLTGNPPPPACAAFA